MSGPDPKYKIKTNDTNLLFVKSNRSRYVPLAGEYEVDKNGVLRYRLRKSSAKVPRNPRKRVFQLTGTYSLDKDYNLLVRLRKRADAKVGQTLRIRGKWIASHANEFVFLYRIRQLNGVVVTRTLRFEGLWKVDRYNRLSFQVSFRRGPSPGTLTLRGAWEIDKKARIVYQYVKPVLGRKGKAKHKLVFSGHWGLHPDLTLYYTLEGNSDFLLKFDSRLAYRRLLAHKGTICYKVGIKVSARSSPVIRRITFYGRWTILSRYELGFEWRQPYDNSATLVFSGSYHVTKNSDIVFLFKKDICGPYSITVRFKRRFLNKRANLFIESTLRNRLAWSLLGGVTLPW